MVVDPLGDLLKLSKQGDIVHTKWELSPSHYIQDPSVIEECLIKHQKSFVRSGGSIRLERLLGKGLLSSNGELHLKQRRLAQQVFIPKLFPGYEAGIRSVVRKRIDDISRHKAFDARFFLTEVTLSVVGKTFFNKEWGTDVRSLGVWVNFLIENLPVLPVWWKEKWRAFLFEKVCTRADNFLYQQIEEKKKAGLDDDLLSRLIAARDLDGDGTGMGDEQLRDELMTFLIAGYETLTSTLSWALYHLAQHPEYQQKIRDDQNHLSEQSYTRKVFQETLRLYPPAWVVFRRALEPIQLSKFKVEAGEHLIISAYTLGRLEKWFPEPENFLPNRWDGPQKYPVGLYIPFGLGSRRCIGEGFSWLEAVIVLKEFCDRFQFALEPKPVVTERPEFTLRPSPGVPLKILA